MKVKELIELLQQTDPERLVVVDGYEGGFDDPAITSSFVVYDMGEDNADLLFGRYSDEAVGQIEPTTAFIIGREGHTWKKELEGAGIRRSSRRSIDNTGEVLEPYEGEEIG